MSMYALSLDFFPLHVFAQSQSLASELLVFNNSDTKDWDSSELY